MVTKSSLFNANLATTLLCAVALLTAPRIASAHQQEVKQHVPFICKLNALTSAERETLHKLGPRLVSAARTTRELPNGYEIAFKNAKEMFPLVAQWLPLEARCCPCFDMEIVVSGRGGPLVVRLTGEDGVKAFIAGELPKLAQLTGAKRK